MMGSAAFADVSAQEVWGDWKAYMSGFGYDVSASEAMSGNTLTVSDLTMNVAIPEEDVTVSINMGQLNFTDQGDGTVAVSLPASQPMVVTVDDEVKITMDYTNDNLSMVVSGAVNDMTYTYSANAVGLMLKEIVAEGEVIPIGSANLSINDISGSSSMKVSNLRNIAQKMSAASITYKMNFANPDNAAEKLDLVGGLNQLMFDGTLSVPMGEFDVNNMANMLKAGFAVDGKYSYTGGKMDFAFIERGETIKASTSSDSGSFDIGMSQDMIKYVINVAGQKVNMMGGDIPFPIEAALGELGFKLILPVSKSDDMKDFGVGLTLADFTTSDLIWSLVDPQGNLPRDPATVAVDLSGRGKLGFDLMDPEQLEAVERGELGIPGEVESLNLNMLQVSAAGASLVGKGGVVVDFMSALMSGGTQGMDGAVDLRLSGANTLAGKLVEMGLVSEGDIGMMPMMLGMFAQQTGDDVYSTKIEVKKDGSILANGQRLQ
ncbi:DUF2125 domain-containing protein [Aliisedimentitalea sp. MJ-SS2]|uniref:DUF2125 domain-containing protein n=1 Tax=Aliisedimentitalea sp. MJ-SS2 TaxID=3049795 RepID=UPI00292F6E29|nr:DUF2125 domain-containing protein [Alisedimentitalea sp. MJ-SS2]